MQNQKHRYWMLVISVIFFLGMIGIFITTVKLYHQTEETTLLFTATVDEVQINGTQNTRHFDIYTEEYTKPLTISTNLCQSVPVSDIHNLKTGDIIQFRIEKEAATALSDESLFVSIVSLATAEREILSLDTYNAAIKEAALPSQIISMAIASVLLIYIIISLCKKRKRKIRNI